MDFVVEDFPVSMKNALAAWAKQETQTKNHPWGKIAVMADPLGNGFCLLQFLGDGCGEDV